MQDVQTLHAGAHPEVFRAVLDPEPAAAFFEEVLSGDHNLVLVAEADGRVIGYIWCQERQPSASLYAQPNHIGYINHVSVDPGRRRHGTGRALVAAVLEELRRRGATRVGVDFWSFNEPARAFFGALGFSVQREVCSLALP